MPKPDTAGGPRAAYPGAFGLVPRLGTRIDARSPGTQKKLLVAAGWIGRRRLILTASHEAGHSTGDFGRRGLIRGSVRLQPSQSASTEHAA
jgi:hypothetical protein